MRQRGIVMGGSGEHWEEAGPDLAERAVEVRDSVPRRDGRR